MFKKVCSIAFFLAFSFFFFVAFPPRTSDSIHREGSPSSSWRWRRRCYRWPVDTFISVGLLTVWGMTWVGASWTSVEPVWKPVLNCQNLASWFPYIVIWWINSKVPEGSMITSENSSVIRESSRMIILKSRLNSTGRSACTSEVRDILDRQTYIPSDWWQLMCSNVLQPWDRRNSMTAPVCYITKLKESEKRNKYLDLAREQKKLWNMKVMVISIVIGAYGTVTKRLVQELEDLIIRGLPHCWDLSEY